MPTAITALTSAVARVNRVLDWLRPLFVLTIRLYIAQVFFRSGLLKLGSWDTTLALFENEYHVPLLPPSLAAVLGTGAELVLPALLALGLGGRFAAAGLTVFNVVAVISYPELGDAGLKDHLHWGMLLLVPLLYGSGGLALDRLLCRRCHG